MVAHHLLTGEIDAIDVIAQHWRPGAAWDDTVEMLGTQLPSTRTGDLLRHLCDSGGKESSAESTLSGSLLAVRILCQRPDQRDVLTWEETVTLGRLVDGLFDQPGMRREVASWLTHLPYLFRALVWYMSQMLFDVDDDNARFDRLYALAGREGWLLTPILALLNGGDGTIRTTVVHAVADRDSVKLHRVVYRELERSTGWVREWWEREKGCGSTGWWDRERAKYDL